MKRILTAIVTVLFIGGCSSKFAYNNIDWLIYWYLDDYIELTDSQEPVFEAQLEDWMNWHRSQELAHYIEHLNSVREDVINNNLTEQRIRFHLQQADAHFERIRSFLAPQLANLAEEMTNEQITYFFAALEKDNQQQEQDIAEFQQKDAAEQLKQRIEDIQEDVKDRIGKLTAEQKQIIAVYAPEFESTSQYWLDYRRTMQSAARSVFVTQKESPDFSQQLSQILLNPDDYRNEIFRSLREENREVYVAMLADLAKTIDGKQKSKLLDKIDGMIRDLEDLQDDD